MEKLKLVHQLFIGKVADEIGIEKTTELLKEAKEAFDIPIVGERSEQLVCVVPDCKNKPIKEAKHGLCGKHIWPNAN